METGVIDLLCVLTFLFIIPIFVYSSLYGLLLCISVFTSKRKSPWRSDAVFITGCDSGIGYSLALYCHELGMTVLAGCLRLGEGTYHLEELKDVHVIPLDVTDSSSIGNAVMRVNNILNENDGIVLKAVVNNAGIMVFGEFAWQTESLIERQIQVNLIGSMNLTKALLPLIIRDRGRIINICSHCSLEALPGLSVYAASKAGLLAWTDALRVELKKFNVPVISFIPGAFPLETAILSKQSDYTDEMKRSMSASVADLYGSYFEEYTSYLSALSEPKKVSKIVDRYLFSMFDDALLQSKPQAHYCYSPWRYWKYHLLFKITPVTVRDCLVIKFVNMPKWKEQRTCAR